MAKKIIITGASGIIGKILKEKIKEKYKLFLIDKKRLKEENFFSVDITNLEKTKNIFLKIKADAVMHLAADSKIDASWNSLLKNNIIGTYNVFEACRISKVRKIIYASSGHVTGIKKEGNKKTRPLSPPKPDSLYAVSKGFGELLAKYYSEKDNISIICLRIGAVLADNNPSKENIHRSIWLSHDDLKQLFLKSLKSNIKFGIFYGVSDNKKNFWDITEAKKQLKYQPKDNAEEFFRAFKNKKSVL